MGNAVPAERWLTVKEAAALIRVTEKFLYRKIAAGSIAVHRFSRKVLRLRPCDVDAYINSTRQPAKRSKGAAS